MIQLTVGEQLDKIQAQLHDEAALWPRAQLLRYFNDAYSDLLSMARCTSRLTQVSVPPRYGYTFCYEWEDRFTEEAPSRMMLWPAQNNRFRCTYYWEAEFLEGITPTNSRAGITQDWERSHIADADHHFVYALPHDTDLIRCVRWDHKKLSATAVKELDETDSAWFRRVGEPSWWTDGTGRRGSIELYELRTDYTQAYSLVDFTAGFARWFSGSNTYQVDSAIIDNAYAYTGGGDTIRTAGVQASPFTGLGWRFTFSSTTVSYTAVQHWEIEQVNGATPSTTGTTRSTYSWEALRFVGTIEEFGVGTIRGITSEDRQYFAVGDNTGGVRFLSSSDDSVEILHTVYPDIELTEDDETGLLPVAAQKYIRYGTLKRALLRTGPGQNAELAKHYADREMQGVKFLKRLADLGAMDRVHVREDADTDTSGRPPYVRLPSNYPSVY